MTSCRTARCRGAGAAYLTNLIASMRGQEASRFPPVLDGAIGSIGLSQPGWDDDGPHRAVFQAPL